MAHLAVFVVFFLVACHGDHQHGDHLHGEATGAECPPDSDLDYQGFGRPFFAQYCNRCHASDVRGPDRNGAPNRHTFDDPEAVRMQADVIDQVAAVGPDAENRRMPPTRPVPSDEERELLAEWLACGAP